MSAILGGAPAAGSRGVRSWPGGGASRPARSG